MTPEDESTVVQTRSLFASKTALAAVENTQDEAVAAEAAQDEAMTAEAEETPVETVEVADEAPVAEAEVAVEVDETTAENLPQADEPVEVEQPVPVEADTNAYVEETAVTEAVEQPVDTAVETVGEVEASEADLAEAHAETEAALAVAEPVPVDAEVEQPATEEGSTAVDVSEALEPAPAKGDTKSVEELQAERDALDAEIKTKVDAEKASVIEQIKTVAETYGITADELAEAMGGLKSKRKGIPAKPKYRDPKTGVIWSGRGKEPAWIKGQARETFLIP